MIQEVTGDILLSKAHAIAHGIAPGDHFDRGLALALRERWPSLARDFRHFCHTSGPKAGQAWTWGSETGTRIICLLTQDAAANEHARPGPARLESVNHALKELSQIAKAEKLSSLALPRLATGVGGLTWEAVRPLIDKHLGEFDIPVFVYSQYQPGVQAQEFAAAEPRAHTERGEQR